MSDLTGKALGKYYIVSRLGRGGMAEVYRAYQSGLARYVAVKVIHSHLAENPDFIERFEWEALAVAQLRHPNIVQIYDFDLAETLYYMVMEFIDGPTLEQELRTRREKESPLTMAEIVRIFTPLGNAIDYAHRRGMVHRDLKPANVMFNAAGEVILTDFGIVRLLAASGFTQAGSITGTPAYMSPEQAQGETVDGRSDQYSLGVMLYEMVVGRLPFEGENPPAMMLKQITQPPPRPCSLNPAVPEAVETVILRALEKSPADRYPAVSDLIEALHRVVGLPPGDHFDALPAVSAAPLILKTIALPAITPSLFPPPEPARPTDITHFVGREAELTHFAACLRQNRPAVISGMAGVGKTALAAALAQVWLGRQMEAAPPQSAADLSAILEKQTVAQGKVFWHTFLPGEGIMTLIWKLAGFLAWRGQNDLWQMLQTAQQHGNQLPPAETLLDYLFQLLRGQKLLLCLDDDHLISDDPLRKAFTTRLQNAIAERAVWAIITSRQHPDFIGDDDLIPLTGLTAADTARLTAERGLTLTPDQVEFLYRHTEGNAELLVLATNTLQRANRPQQVLERLAESEDIERYLITELDSTLDDDERKVMEAVAVLLGYPGTRNAIETVLDSGGIRRLLRDLTDHYLLLLNKGQLERAYSEHAMVQTFYYDSLSRSRRRAMHRLAAEYYEVEDPDPFKTALHYFHAGDYEKAARFAAGDVWAMINRGQARPLRPLLTRLEQGQMEKETRAKINLALGEVCAFLGQREQAEASYQAALTALERLPASSATRLLQAKICRGLGDLLRYESQSIALDWFRRGLTFADETETEERVALLLKISTLQMYGEDTETALAGVQQSFSLLPPGPGWLRLGALTNLGIIYYRQGKLTEAVNAIEEGLVISRSLNRLFTTAVLWNNLGVFKDEMGDWPGSIEAYQEALALSEQLGDVRNQIRAGANLGFQYLKQGRDSLALEYLSAGLASAGAHNVESYKMYIQVSLATLYLRQTDLPRAAAALAEAETLAIKTGTTEDLPAIRRGWAEYHLLAGKPEPALERAGQALDAARGLKMPLEEGVSLRVLAQVHLARHDCRAAMEAFGQSLALLEGKDPYEAARTQTEWGRHLLTGTDPETGKQLLQCAGRTFENLGAQRDWAMVRALLVA